MALLTVHLPAEAAPEDGGAFLLGPPKSDGPAQDGPVRDGPVRVQASFELRDINGVDDVSESFELAGVLTLRWRDPRRAFDPAAAGTAEKVYQGNFQVAEIAAGWYPQMVLANEAGLFQVSGIALRVRPDGASTLVQTVNAVAEARFDMRRFPFDRQRLEAMFQVPGFGADEVMLEVAPGAEASLIRDLAIPQWRVTGARIVAGTRAAPAGAGAASTLTVSVDVERESFYVRRLITLPLVLIVLLSFSVFWMDRSSLGDRLSVSFMGILSAVAYQFVMSELLPPISYFTLMHGFLTLSFLIMCISVVVNLVAGRLDQRGKAALSDRIDGISRWVFPLAYFGLLFLMVGVTMLVT
ncbi:MAG: hypothetical protein AB7O49_12060 [Sphingomonadales bacterium]